MTDREQKSVRKAAKKAAARPSLRADQADGEAAVLAKIAAMPAPCCAMGERLHALILRSAPALQPTLYYGMPWYAKDGRRVCFFRTDKYMTFGHRGGQPHPRGGRAAPVPCIRVALRRAGRPDRGQALRHCAHGRKMRTRPKPLQEVDAWLARFRRFWSAHVDALKRHLDRMDQSTRTKRKKRRKR
jgi:hypothetical protein